MNELIEALAKAENMDPKKYREMWLKMATVDWDCPYYGRTLTYDPITQKATLSKKY